MTQVQIGTETAIVERSLYCACATAIGGRRKERERERERDIEQ